MLKEIESAQKEIEIFRKWYKDEFFELIVWFDNKNETIVGFQLCYDIMGNEHSLTWTVENGFKHNKIDSGATPLKYPSTPLICPDGLFNTQFIFDKFIDSCLKIDKLLSLFILIKIIEFGSLNIKIDELINLLYKKSIYLKNEEENINLFSTLISNDDNQYDITTKEFDILDINNNFQYGVTTKELDILDINNSNNENTTVKENIINKKSNDEEFDIFKYIFERISRLEERISLFFNNKKLIIKQKIENHNKKILDDTEYDKTMDDFNELVKKSKIKTKKLSKKMR